ncbi:MAG: N-acetylmuramoyl-L-alanine amidase [Ruminococcus flavefaciens]|nr:N-acetylmuramoyl-L-alanine amidase [Ruminococcus flavefaciens]
MSNSALVSYTKISPNKNSPRNKAIDRISIHCVVGQCTAERLGEIFAPSSKQASSNYGIGLDGRIGMYVEEKDRSWCTSSSANDNRAVTIEVASDTEHPYAVKAAAYAALLDLCTDICKRNGKKRLLWFGDKDKTLAYTPQADEMVLTVHRWFANKACPGEYLYSRHGEIAEEVTKRLAAADKPAEAEAPAGTGDNPSAWAKAATEYCKRKGIFAGDGAGNFDWQKPITREQVAAVLYRTLEAAGLLEELPDKA